MNTEDKEQLRHAILECLVARHPAALPVAGIMRRVKTTTDFPCDLEDVVGALAVLEGLGLVKWTHDELGSSRWWSATSDGVLKCERA